MADMNKVMLIGNLTKDPEVKQIGSGSTVCNMRMAITEKYKNKQGENVESTCYVDVAAWGRQAETCGEYLKKGSAALVEGRLSYEEWEKDGQKRSMLRVKADRVQFLGGKPGAAKDKRSDEPLIDPDED